MRIGAQEAVSAPNIEPELHSSSLLPSTEPSSFVSIEKSQIMLGMSPSPGAVSAGVVFCARRRWPSSIEPYAERTCGRRFSFKQSSGFMRTNSSWG